MSKSLPIPDMVSDDMIAYLDKLRTLGTVNMFGAGPYLEANFELTTNQARKVLVYWMESLCEREGVQP
jgi:hypothetical protein